MIDMVYDDVMVSLAKAMILVKKRIMRNKGMLALSLV
jgi:hypothetical protein